MINVMYIVLLALLALQVPREVSTAFLRINDGIVGSNASLDNITEASIRAISTKGRNGDQRALEYADRALNIYGVSSTLYDRIDSVKQQLINILGVDKKTGLIARPEEIAVTSEVLVTGEDNGVNDGLAYALEREVRLAREAMLAQMPREQMENNKPGSFDQLNSELPLTRMLIVPEEVQGLDWAGYTFDQLPAAGAIAMLSQVQSDLKSTENILIEELREQVSAGHNFDHLSARIVAPSSYILRGQKFTADVFLSASSSQVDNVVVTANGRRLALNESGVATFETATDRVGPNAVRGKIEVRNTTTGDVTDYPFDFTYTVAEPFANVTPTKMNVFYMGLQNPISVSAAGVLAEDLRVSVNHGQLAGSSGSYRVKVMEEREATVTVRDRDGTVHGVYPFRVKKTPDPVAEVGGRSGGNMRAAEFRAQRALKAELKDFVFDTKFDVVGFDMVYIPYDETLQVASADSDGFDSRMASYVQKARPRDRYDFENIRVRGEDGITRRIPGISFRIR